MAPGRQLDSLLMIVYGEVPELQSQEERLYEGWWSRLSRCLIWCDLMSSARSLDSDPGLPCSKSTRGGRRKSPQKPWSPMAYGARIETPESYFRSFIP